MIEVLIQGRGFNKQGDSVWIGRGEGSSAMTIPLVDVSGGMRHQTIETE